MFRCYSYTVIGERINLCLLKLQLLKQSIKIHQCVVKSVVVWLHILGLYWCMYVALLGSRVLTTHRCILMDYFKNCNFSKHKLMRSLMLV